MKNSVWALVLAALVIGCKTKSPDPNRPLRPPKGYMNETFLKISYALRMVDSLVPVSQSDSLDSWLGKAGVPHYYHRLKGWPHTMDLSVKVNDYCQFYIDAFLEKHL